MTVEQVIWVDQKMTVPGKRGDETALRDGMTLYFCPSALAADVDENTAYHVTLDASERKEVRRIWRFFR